MARMKIAGPVQDEAGNRLGSGVELRFYSDEGVTAKTFYSNGGAGGALASPLKPGTGWQTQLQVGHAILTTDTQVYGIDVSGFSVGQRLFIYDGTNIVYRTITAIDGVNKILTVDSAVGTAFAVANTQLGGPHMNGTIGVWVDDTTQTFIQVKDVGSGVLMDFIQIETAAPLTTINVQDEGTLVNNRGTINIVGPGIAATDDGANSRINITLDPNGFIVAGTHAGRPAAGVNGRLYIYTDAPIGISRDNGASWLDVGFQNPMTTAEDLIKGGASGAQARVAVGTDGSVLRVAAGVVGWGAHLTAEALLGADVNITANVYADLVSISLAAGTWAIFGQVQSRPGSGNKSTAKLWDGTTVKASGEYVDEGGATSAGLGMITLGCLVTLGSTTTWKISGTNTATITAVFLAAAADNGAGNNATKIWAVRIG